MNMAYLMVRQYRLFSFSGEQIIKDKTRFFIRGVDDYQQLTGIDPERAT